MQGRGVVNQEGGVGEKRYDAVWALAADLVSSAECPFRHDELRAFSYVVDFGCGSLNATAIKLFVVFVLGAVEAKVGSQVLELGEEFVG